MKKIILDPGDSPNSRGLFSFVIQYLSAHRHYYENHDVFIYCDLECKSLYHDINIDFTNNVWDYFFDNFPCLENYSSVERTVWTDAGNFYGYSFDFLNQKEREIASKIILEKLIIKEGILEKINKFYEENFKNKKILGIHKRGTDIGIHYEPINIEKYFEEIDSIKDNYDYIFICADERSSIDSFKSRYDNIICYSYRTASSDITQPNFKSPNSSKYDLGEEALIDSILLSKVDFLIQTNSNLSNFSLLKNSNLNFKRLQ